MLQVSDLTDGPQPVNVTGEQLLQHGPVSAVPSMHEGAAWYFPLLKTACAQCSSVWFPRLPQYAYRSCMVLIPSHCAPPCA